LDWLSNPTASTPDAARRIRKSGADRAGFGDVVEVLSITTAELASDDPWKMEISDLSRRHWTCSLAHS
jgi:hypothetical protein